MLYIFLTLLFINKIQIPFISSLPLTGILFFFKTLTNSFSLIHSFLQRNRVTAESTASIRDLIIARAKTIAVVVPSPAKSFILVATCKEDMKIYISMIALSQKTSIQQQERELSSNHEWPLGLALLLHSQLNLKALWIEQL